MTAQQTDLACKFIDLAAHVIKEVLRARSGHMIDITPKRRAPIIRKRKIMDR